MSSLKSNPRFINTVLFGGSFTETLDAISEAGFDGIEVWQQDAGNKATTLKQQLNALRLACIDYQVLLDFDGAVGESRQEKYHEALTMIAHAKQLAAPMILVAANTAQCDRQTIVADIKWLCQQANTAGLRVAYEAMSWSTEIDQCDKAWQIIQQVNEDNLGIVIDTFHLYALRRTIDDLVGIPVEKIFLVQLSDITLPLHREALKPLARHHRLLPGDGNFPLLELMKHLIQLGYKGPIGLEVFNDHAREQPSKRIALQAKQALERLIERATGCSDT